MELGQRHHLMKMLAIWPFFSLLLLCATNNQAKANNNYQCQSEGFHVNPNDCARFVRCLNQDGDLAAYHFSCPAVTEFDETIIGCNWPDKISRPAAGQCQGGRSDRWQEGYEFGQQMNRIRDNRPRFQQPAQQAWYRQSQTPGDQFDAASQLRPLVRNVQSQQQLPMQCCPALSE